ncbi:hypothetical protein [Shewanella salipaludis]|uniref:DUF4760 domain-containing protein n=1 Tax=Shewanella salipaludis TaxID=2723052 RepID=A0A972JLP9_9GAMM|nr:hypothetical protein [Shewanella salipaludis]NMH64311.1 hypothetical protein [Shewanella salipaludis]
MSETVMVSLIAGSVSLIVALFGILATQIQYRNALRKIKIDLENKYTERLYEERINIYPEGFRIASRIRKLRKPELITPKHVQEEILKELNIWSEGSAGLYLSNNAIDAYFKLREALAKNPGNGEFYTEIQADNLWKARSEFRKALREDIGNLHK